MRLQVLKVLSPASPSGLCYDYWTWNILFQPQLRHDTKRRISGVQGFDKPLQDGAIMDLLSVTATARDCIIHTAQALVRSLATRVAWRFEGPQFETQSKSEVTWLRGL